MKTLFLSCCIAFLATQTVAEGHSNPQGDVEAGAEQFRRQCVACHVVADSTGEVLAGRNAKVGPNLYGIAGREIGSYAGYRYGDSILEVGVTGAIWTEDRFINFVQNPTNWLRETLESRRARAKMAYQVRNEGQAYNIFAYLATFGAE